MRTFTRLIPVELDVDVDAAVLRIGDLPSPRELVDIPIDVGGSTMGILTFATSGRLVQIELLSASTQIPQLLSEE